MKQISQCSNQKVKSYYGLTKEEVKLSILNYSKKNISFDGKMINLSLKGLIDFINDFNMQSIIKYYTIIDLSNFEVIDNILPDLKYASITIKTPFSFNIDNYYKLPQIYKEID